jgi:hypothetical protein
MESIGNMSLKDIKIEIAEIKTAIKKYPNANSGVAQERLIRLEMELKTRPTNK